MPSLQGVLESGLEAIFAQIAQFRVGKVQDGLTLRVLFIYL